MMREKQKEIIYKNLKKMNIQTKKQMTFVNQSNS